MNAYLVSCLIPAYNAARFITETLDSIVAQTHRPIEIVVVDDGSTDATADVVRHHDAEITLVEAEHAGLIPARDAAIEAATGDWIAFCDADDLWVPDKLRRQLAVFESDPDVDVCVGQYLNFWDEEAAQEAERYAGQPLSEPISGWIVPTMLARREVFERYGRFGDAIRPSDTGWFATAVERGCLVETLEQVVMHRRVHTTNDSLTGEDPLGGLFDLIKIRADARRGRIDR
ncbi:MAG: glycosyltransferase family A protein [Acidimicrobiales bacterium]